MTHVIGIDLGTTNCCVAVVDGVRPVVLSNRAGYATTPSVIAVAEDGTRLVGQLAVRQAVTNPRHTVHASKRLIGRPFDAPQVQHAVQRSAFEIVEGPQGDVRIMLRGRAYSIPELSAMLLQEMRLVAEDRLGGPIERAVVTVPAYFNDNQRQAVRDAGKIAGLEIVRILNEPTAAALAYGFDRQENRTLAVFDLGGGTFDVSIVHVGPESGFDVVATTGDSYLGGEDFDDRIVAWLLERVREQHGADLRTLPTALQRLREAAQKAKNELSEVTETDISLPFLATMEDGAPVHLEVELSRSWLEQMTGDLVTRSLQICERALRLAELRVEDIDEVILVGGMTRMPAIQRAVSEFFEREPCRGVHPDEVVALGAALSGFQSLSDGRSGLLPLRDVTAHSLGIVVAGGRFEPLIAANTTVPTRTSSVFATSRDGQETVKIIVLQGEHELAAENEFLGQFAMTGLRPAPAGETEVEVMFEIDTDGLFRVAAIDRETGEARQIQVLAQSGITPDEIAQMMQESAAYLAQRRQEEQDERSRQGIEVTLAEFDRILPEAEARLERTTIAPAALTQARMTAERVRQVAREGNPGALEAEVSQLRVITDTLRRTLG